MALATADYDTRRLRCCDYVPSFVRFFQSLEPLSTGAIFSWKALGFFGRPATENRHSQQGRANNSKQTSRVQAEQQKRPNKHRSNSSLLLHPSNSAPLLPTPFPSPYPTSPILQKHPSPITPSPPPPPKPQPHSLSPPLPATATHCQPLPATASHCQPLPATATHYRPLPPTATDVSLLEGNTPILIHKGCVHPGSTLFPNSERRCPSLQRGTHQPTPTATRLPCAPTPGRAAAARARTLPAAKSLGTSGDSRRDRFKQTARPRPSQRCGMFWSWHLCGVCFKDELFRRPAKREYANRSARPRENILPCKLTWNQQKNPSKDASCNAGKQLSRGTCPPTGKRNTPPPARPSGRPSAALRLQLLSQLPVHRVHL